MYPTEEQENPSSPMSLYLYLWKNLSFDFQKVRDGACISGEEVKKKANSEKL